MEAWLYERGIEIEHFTQKKILAANRDVRNVYYAVGMIFAGDTPGSPFGEFALASDLGPLSKELRFSLRPVFEPRSSFRKLRTRPEDRGRGGNEDPGSIRGRTHPNKSGFVHGFTITAQERADLLAFLQGLTDETFLADPRFSDPFAIATDTDAGADTDGTLP